MKRRQLLAVAATTSATPVLMGTAPVATGGTVREVMPGDSIQEALDASPGRVVLAPGTHTLAAPLEMRPHRWLSGVLGATILRATEPVPVVLVVGNGRPIDRWKVSDLVIDARGASTGIDINIIGTAGNTGGEPDSQGRIDDVIITDPESHGIWYHGADAQAIITRGVRVRRAGSHAYRIESSDCWWSECEGTTLGDGGAGFYIEGSNHHFEHCKAWYCRGYGWHLRGVRNVFTGCESQDTRDHGWRIDYEENTLVGCIADTASMYDVGGAPGSADGFFVGPDSRIVLTGCLSYDRQPGDHVSQQRFGFNVPRALFDAGLLVGCTGWNNAASVFNLRG
jgi:Right handed beta helix region